VRQSFRPPRSPSERAQVDALSSELATASALHVTGRYKEALAIVEPIEREATPPKPKD
jgi:hypothetical protein